MIVAKKRNGGKELLGFNPRVTFGTVLSGSNSRQNLSEEEQAAHFFGINPFQSAKTLNRIDMVGRP
jgi:hypothetical protein